MAIVVKDVDMAGLTTATTNYTAGDQLGTLVTVTSFATGANVGVKILSAIILDQSMVLGPTDALIYSASVTLAADNAAASVSDADNLLLIGTLSFGGFVQGTLNGYSQLITGLPVTLAPTATSVYVSFTTRSNNNFFTASAFPRLRLTLDQS